MPKLPPENIVSVTSTGACDHMDRSGPVKMSWSCVQQREPKHQKQQKAHFIHRKLLISDSQQEIKVIRSRDVLERSWLLRRRVGVIKSVESGTM